MFCNREVVDIEFRNITNLLPFRKRHRKIGHIAVVYIDDV